MSAEHVASAIRGQELAAKTIAIIGTGCAMPDELHCRMQELRALGDGEALRHFVRQVQKTLEAAAPRRKYERQ